MVNERSLFSTGEHKEYTGLSVMWLTRYLEYLNILEKWFGEINEDLPLPCRTNYRDAWFHYKKIYERRDYIKVFQEQYAMEEHLIRAIKDAINKYFQIWIYDMETVYKAIKTGKLEKSIDKYKRLFEHLRISLTIGQQGWEQKLYKEMDEKKALDYFSKIVLYVYAKEMDQKKAVEGLQKCIHKTKNYCAKIRLHGTDIYRPASNEEYMEECQSVYNELIDTLETLQLKNVLSILSDECQDVTP